MPQRPSRVVNDAIIRVFDRRKHQMRLGLLSTIRGAAPVDTGELRSSIRAGRGNVLVEIQGAPQWFYNEIGVPHPGNRANKNWLSNALDRFMRRNGIKRVSTNLP